MHFDPEYSPLVQEDFFPVGDRPFHRDATVSYQGPGTGQRHTFDTPLVGLVPRQAPCGIASPSSTAGAERDEFSAGGVGHTQTHPAAPFGDANGAQLPLAA